MHSSNNNKGIINKVYSIETIMGKCNKEINHMSSNHKDLKVIRIPMGISQYIKDIKTIKNSSIFHQELDNNNNNNKSSICNKHSS